MAIIPKNPGIQRISESEDTRVTANNSHQSQHKTGKTCVGCRKYYNYLRATQKLCSSCELRLGTLNNYKK